MMQYREIQSGEAADQIVSLLRGVHAGDDAEIDGAVHSSGGVRDAEFLGGPASFLIGSDADPTNLHAAKTLQGPQVARPEFPRSNDSELKV
jgi:hypothetical protein